MGSSSHLAEGQRDVPLDRRTPPLPALVLEPQRALGIEPEVEGQVATVGAGPAVGGPLVWQLEVDVVALEPVVPRAIAS